MTHRLQEPAINKIFDLKTYATNAKGAHSLNRHGTRVQIDVRPLINDPLKTNQNLGNLNKLDQNEIALRFYSPNDRVELPKGLPKSQSKHGPSEGDLAPPKEASLS